MKPPRPLLLFALASSVLFVLFHQGCTLIGLISGAAVDSGKPSQTIVSSWEIDAIHPGSTVMLYMKDGTVLQGDFERLEQDTAQGYRARYEAFKAGNPAAASLPEPGDSITVRLKGSQPQPTTLVAYDRNSLMVTSLRSVDWTINYRNLDSLTHDGFNWSGPNLRGVVLSSRAPIYSMLVLRDKTSAATGSVRRIPLNDIDEVSSKNAKWGWLIGMGIGAAVDAAVIIAISSNGGMGPMGGGHHSGGNGSCPFVYSFDGREYVMDSETFSGAICQALQRTTWDRLDHLKQVGDSCSLRIANHLHETQYVDALNVLVVDHPFGSEVVADAAGVIQTVGTVAGPTEAHDFAGAVVTRLVASQDSLSWTSSPVGRDPEDAYSARDGLTLTFDRAAGAGAAKLLVTTRNTPWALELEKNLMTLQGSNLDRWYEEMNDSPEFRNEFLNIVKREAMLAVQIWDGTAWTPVDWLPFPGPYVAKTFVLPLDLRGIPGSEVRLRIESTVGLWTVNSVGIDYTPQLPVRVARASLARALSNGGKDLRQALAASDGQYYTLEQGDQAALTFAAPPANPGSRRTFILEATGYYTVHVTPSGSPQWALLRSFSAEPGAFGRFSLRLFDGWLEEQLAGMAPADIRAPQ